MKTSRSLLAFLTLMAVTGTAALAIPPIGAGVGAGAHGGVNVGAPPVAVPPVQVPPAKVPPVSVPKPLGTAVPAANANGRSNVQAQGSLNGDVLHGTVTNVSGTTVTVQLGNGTVQTYAVSSQTAARLQSYLNKAIAFRVQSGALNLIGQGTPPLHGTLIAVSGGMAQIKLSNGTTQSYAVSAQQAAWLQAHLGKRVAFWSDANGSIELDQSARASNKARAARKAKGHRDHDDGGNP